MSLKSLQPRTTILIGMIILATAFRLIQSSPIFSFMSNVTPVGAIALFGGYYFADRWKAFIVPLAALLVSDILLNRIYYFDSWTVFYPGAYWIYGSFAIVVMLGHFIKKITVLNVTLAGVGAALTHFLISDFGTWAGGGMDVTTGLPYSADLNGLLKCYYLALPFLRNMIVGNLVFAGVLFGTFEWMQQKYPSLKIEKA